MLNNDIFKQTLWTGLDAARVVILEDYGESRKLRHPNLKRPLYFVKSRRGNWYWRATDRQTDWHARGYIIK